MTQVEGASIEHLDHLGVYLHGWAVQAPAVDAEKHIGSRERHPFVAVHQRVVDRQARHQANRLGQDVVVAARLGTEKIRLQRVTRSRTPEAPP